MPYQALSLIADNFKFTDVEFVVKYWSALATICNVWRSTGIPKKLKRAVESLYGPVVAKRIVGNLPGRPVRQRWGACQSCQKRIDEGGDILAEAFQIAVKSKAERRRAKRAKQALGDDLGAGLEEFRAERKKYRETACEMIGLVQFRVMVRICRLTMDPATRFFFIITTKRNRFAT